MTSSTPAHDFLLPRLTRLIDDTVATGIARDVAVAVLIDLVTSPRFDEALPTPADEAVAQPLWRRDADSLVLVNGVSPQGPLDLDARHEANFVKPIPSIGPS